MLEFLFIILMVRISLCIFLFLVKLSNAEDPLWEGR